MFQSQGALQFLESIQTLYLCSSKRNFSFLFYLLLSIIFVTTPSFWWPIRRWQEFYPLTLQRSSFRCPRSKLYWPSDGLFSAIWFQSSRDHRSFYMLPQLTSFSSWLLVSLQDTSPMIIVTPFVSIWEHDDRCTCNSGIQRALLRVILMLGALTATAPLCLPATTCLWASLNSTGKISSIHMKRFTSFKDMFQYTAIQQGSRPSYL